MNHMKLRQMMALGMFGAGSPIYGVSWNKQADPTLTRTDAAIGKTANAGVDANVVVNDFDSIYPWSQMVDVTDGLGNTFVRIPRFYIRKTDGVGYKTWQVSAKSHGADWYLPACFVNQATGAILPYVDFGKYNASLSGANKLESKTGVYPLVNKNIVDFRGYAQANGAGYQQLDVHAYDILQTLFYIEFATLNSQAIMAGSSSNRHLVTDTATVAENAVNRVIVANAVAANFVVGQTIGLGTTLGGNQIFSSRKITSITVYDVNNKALNTDGAAYNVAIGNIVYTTGWISGATDGVTAKSGSLTHNTNGLYPCKYRGVENPWGNVWQFVDGVNINDRQAWVCLNPASYQSNLFAAPYTQVGYINGGANGYLTEVGWDANYPFLAFPTAIGGSSATYYSDYYYQDVGQRVARVGAGWLNGSGAGVSYWSLDYSSSGAYLVVGGRLVRKALS